MVDELVLYYTSEILKKPKSKQNMALFEKLSLLFICLGLIAYVIFLLLDKAKVELGIILIMFVLITGFAIAEKIYMNKPDIIKIQKSNYNSRIHRLKKYLKREKIYTEKMLGYLIEECEEQLDGRNGNGENVFELIKQLVTYIPALTIGILETWITDEVTATLAINQEIKIVIITAVLIRLLMLSFEFATKYIKTIHNRK